MEEKTPQQQADKFIAADAELDAAITELAIRQETDRGR
jgi:hypothetical protein